MGKRRDRQRMELFNLGVVLGNVTDSSVVTREVLDEIVDMAADAGWNSNQHRSRAANIIQAWWRSTLKMRRQTRAAQAIQAWWKSIMLMKKAEKKKEPVCTVR